MKTAEPIEEDFDEIEDRLILEYVETASPKLLHQMAMEWNWDSSAPFLNWLANNPQTDKATALMLYWMSGPRYHKQYENAEAAQAGIGYKSSGFDFSENLESKYLNGFFSNAQFSFDPNVKDHAGTTWTNEYADLKTVRNIPAIMFEKVDGKAVEPPADFIEGMPPDLYEKWETLYNEYYADEDESEEG